MLSFRRTIVTAGVVFLFASSATGAALAERTARPHTLQALHVLRAPAHAASAWPGLAPAAAVPDLPAPIPAGAAVPPQPPPPVVIGQGDLCPGAGSTPAAALSAHRSGPPRAVLVDASTSSSSPLPGVSVPNVGLPTGPTDGSSGGALGLSTPVTTPSVPLPVPVPVPTSDPSSLVPPPADAVTTPAPSDSGSGTGGSIPAPLPLPSLPPLPLSGPGAAPPAGAPAPTAPGTPAVSGDIGCAVLGSGVVGQPAPGETLIQMAAVRQAISLLGIPYVYAGESPTVGFDCSGLVQYVYRLSGLALPRVAQDQFDAGPAVPPGTPAVPGDLVFFGSSASDVQHVGIYVGDGVMINAPHTGAVVRFDRIDGFGPVVGVTAPGT